MIIEIPDNKLLKIMKGVQDICTADLEAEDPAPGIGKTENQFTWFQDLNLILHEHLQHEVGLAFENAIDGCFCKIQEALDITSGDEPFDSSYKATKEAFIKECVRIIMFQRR